MNSHIIYAIGTYGIWLWPIMVVFGFAFGMKELLREDIGKSVIPLLIAAIGIFFLAVPLYLDFN